MSDGDAIGRGDAARHVESCVHCGMCLPACPTYDLTGNELDSPRGRIDLVRGLVTGDTGESTDARLVGHHLDRCLGCRACETACPSGVPYGEILAAGRAHLLALRTTGRGLPVRERAEGRAASEVGGEATRESGGAAGTHGGADDGSATPTTRPAAAPPAVRSVGELVVAGLLRAFASPAATTLAMRFTGLARLPVVGTISRSLPGAAGAVARLAPAVTWTPWSHGVARVVPAMRLRRGAVALLPGCVMDHAYARVHDATVALLRAAGFDVHVPKGPICCGALHAHVGDTGTARELAARLADALGAEFASGATTAQSTEDSPGPHGPGRSVGPSPATGTIVVPREDPTAGHRDPRPWPTNDWAVAPSDGPAAVRGNAGPRPATERTLAPREGPTARPRNGTSPAIEALVVDAAGCGSHLKETPGPWAGRVFDVLEFLDARGGPPAPVTDAATALATLVPGHAGPSRVRAAWAPPCHLLHGQRVRDAPLRLLGAVPGLDVVVLRDADRCCGSAGVYNLLQPEIAGALLDSKVTAIRDAVPDVLVSANPGCQIQIAAGLRAAGLRVPVVHAVELLAAIHVAGFGGLAPAQNR